MSIKKKAAIIIASILVVFVCIILIIIAVTRAPKIDNTAELIKVGDYTIGMDEYKVWVLPSKIYYENTLNDDNFFNTVSGNKYGKELLQSINESIVKRYVCLSMADAMGIYLTEEEQREIRDEYEAEAVAGLDLYGMASEIYYRVYYLDQMREEKLLEHIYKELEQNVSEEEISAFEEENRLTGVQQILIRNDVGESEEDNLKLAEDILERLNQGESFYTLMHQYSDDRTLEDAPEGWVLSLDDDQYAEYFIEELESLEPYEISGVMEYSDEWQSWYLIIQRLPPMDDSTRYMLVEEEVENTVEEYSKEIGVGYCDGFERLKLSNLEEY